MATNVPREMFGPTKTTLTKFNVWCEGDSSVGLAGARATVTMDCEADIDDIKECLKECFENIWNDDVKVMTDEDIARDIARDSKQGAA